jgi:hypothetical protein
MWFSSVLGNIRARDISGNDLDARRDEAIIWVRVKFKLTTVATDHPAVQALLCANAVAFVGDMTPSSVVEIHGHMIRAWEEYSKLRVNLGSEMDGS